MSSNPEQGDPPDTPDAVAWTVRNCADRLSSMAEATWEPLGDSHVYWSLWHAADMAWDAASKIDGGEGERP